MKKSRGPHCGAVLALGLILVAPGVLAAQDSTEEQSYAPREVLTCDLTFAVLSSTEGEPSRVRSCPVADETYEVSFFPAPRLGPQHVDSVRIVTRGPERHEVAAYLTPDGERQLSELRDPSMLGGRVGMVVGGEVVHRANPHSWQRTDRLVVFTGTRRLKARRIARTLRAAVGARAGVGPRPAAAQDRPVVLSRATDDFNEDGRPDTLQVLMVEGRRDHDQEDWCGRGEKVEGRFFVEVRLAGGPARRRPLGEDFRWFRDRDWTPVLADYNGDGQVDVNFGQYRSCNGWRYRLFTVRPSGRVRELSVSGGSWIPAAAFENSTNRLVPTEDGFRACWYNNASGHLRERYRWSEGAKQFEIERTRRVQECGSPERPDDASPAGGRR